MRHDGSLNVAVIDHYVDHLASLGIFNVFVNGTSGESMSLSVQERKTIAQKWMEAGAKKLKNIIIHCGAGNLSDSKELAAHAEKIHAHAVAVVAPAYFRPQNIETVVEYCREVAAAAPKTPFLFYHFPALNGVEVSVTEFLSLASGCIPNLAGVKFTSTALGDAAQAARLMDGNFEIFNGFDQMFLGALAMGIPSSIGMSWSLMGRAGNRLLNAFQTGDLETARWEQTKIQDALFAITGTYNSDVQHLISCFKAAMGLAGVQLGPPRLPMREQSAQEVSNLKARLDQVDFWAFIQ